MTAGRLAGCEVGITWLGMRLSNRKEFEAVVTRYQPGIVVNSGFAGAIRALLEPGDLLLAENFSSPENVNRLRTTSLFDARGAFTCVNEVAGPADKLRISLEGNILAVDIESARCAAICRERAVPYVTARMVSDRRDEEIPGIFVGKGLRQTRDISDAIGFASRMIQLRPRLADRLTKLIDILGRD